MSKFNNIRNQKVRIGQHSFQESLFLAKDAAENNSLASSSECQVISVGKRRDGGTRYWCLTHKADATAKYGKPASACRASHIPPISSEDTLLLNVDQYKGGIALWGAVPAVYDTTRLPMDRGVHVHARVTADAKKEMDWTFRAVRLVGNRLPKEGILVSELDAIYYMVTSIFGYEMKYILCSHCGYAHLDRDWFSVHPHRRHLCAGCGRHFPDNEIAIGNPICGVRDACGVAVQKSVLSKKTLNIKQEDFPGGIQLWGSNPAFLWTSTLPEAEGIHVHAFRDGNPKPKTEPDLDETFGEVTIDGVKLDPSMVRISMAQSVLPSLKNRILAINCPSCNEPQFDVGKLAFTPESARDCKVCSHQFSAPGRLRKTIANPLPAILAMFAANAPRPPQKHDLGLMPETL